VRPEREDDARRHRNGPGPRNWQESIEHRCFREKNVVVPWQLHHHSGGYNMDTYIYIYIYIYGSRELIIKKSGARAQHSI
jgi:hypothetical protein